MPELKRLPAAFYQTPSGKEPVRDWLLALDEKSRRTVGRDIAMVLLHGFVKKARKTPRADLELAKQRAKEIKS